MRKAQKILLIIGVGLLVLQIPWYFVVLAAGNKTMTKTAATVIRIDRIPSNCYGSFCDRSDTLFPVYEYVDQQGRRHEQDDRYFGAFKQNNPLGKLFMKRVGDTVAAYYTKDKPDEVVFMASVAAYTALLIPLYLAVLVLIAYGLVLTVPLLDKLVQRKN